MITSVTTQKLNQGKENRQSRYQHSCTTPSGAMERRKRDANNYPQKNNSLQDSVGNEENVHSVPDPNKTMINVTKEPSGAHKNTLKEEILEEIIEKFMEKVLGMVNQNVQDPLKKFQDTENKENEKT
jgi:hypothetical protein